MKDITFKSREPVTLIDRKGSSGQEGMEAWAGDLLGLRGQETAKDKVRIRWRGRV